MNSKVTAIVAHLGFIGWLIAFLAGDKEGAKFWLNQTLIQLLIGIAVGMSSSILVLIPFVGWFAPLIGLVCWIFLCVCWFTTLIGACKSEEKAMPLIGNLNLLK